MTPPPFPFADPSFRNLTLGAQGIPVTRLQEYLRQFGYLRMERERAARDPYAFLRSPKAPAAKDGVFDKPTSEGLRAWQSFYGLNDTGVLDPVTAALMSQPRCGVPDTPFGSRAPGDTWPSPTLSYALANTTPDLPAVTVMSAIKQALDTWASVTRLKFTEAQVPSGAEIVVSFQSGDHGDGNPFDGAGGTLAHAYYPTVPPTPIAGDTHFDEAETWSLSVPPSTGAFDLLTVAIHEFGHALGLDHSKDPGATMFATYAGLRRGLALDDIQRIQKLYGASATPPPLPPTPVARAPHLNLGILLGTLQQGLRVPRRLNPMMAGDLQGISSEAPKGGYVQFEGYVQQASGLLQQRDYLAMAQSVALLMVLLQGQVVGPQRLVQASALSLGISLGWLQQGAAAGSRLVPETVEGLNYVRLHAPNAGFTGYEPSVSSALQMLQSTQDVRRILPIVTQLITFLQNQSLT
jgi:peptidoglycan hydrolase-like protein with peptidoglycan-binding domain